MLLFLPIALCMISVIDPVVASSKPPMSAAVDFSESSSAAVASRKIHPSMQLRFDEVGPDGQVHAWLFFEGTKGLPMAQAREAAIQQVADKYGSVATSRRQLRRSRPGLFDLDDVPVPQAYLEAIMNTGATVHVVSRWVNGASVRATRQQLERIAELPFVTTIQPVRRGRGGDRIETQIDGRGRSLLESGSTAGGFYGVSEAQLEQINLTSLHTQGFTGAGVRVGVLDTGFQRTHEAFLEPGHSLVVNAEHDFVNNDSDTSFQGGDPSDQHFHGTLILGVLGAYKPGELVGGAYDASFILCKTEDTTAEYPAEEDNYVAGLEFIESNGGDMATASLGYIDWYTQEDLDGLTAVTTIAVNVATANGVHCCNAAGNGGHDADPLTSQLIAPADALQVITCGAVNDLGNIAGFSSDGPTADGRVKPELLALGVSTQTVYPFDNTNYTGANGTSLATPVVASAVACLIQAHPDWTIEQMRWYLLHTASDYVANDATDPQFVRGYGIVNAASASAGDCNGNLVPDATDISNETSQDCNGNLIPDECDIDVDPSLDVNENGVIDSCDNPPAPAVSTWGILISCLLLLVAGTKVSSRHRAMY